MGNGITDELRKYTDVAEMVSENTAATKLLRDIADRIDAAYEKAMTDPRLLFLPEDACYEHIRIGDEVEELNTRADGRVHGEVISIVFGKYGTSVLIDTGFSYVALCPCDVRHSCRKPTVEDILQEFGDEAAMDCSSKETIIEFASRIREAVRDEQ